MKTFFKLSKYLLLSAASAIALVCFAFALFFGVASALSITKVSLADFKVLAGFFVVFSIAGNGFTTCADQLYMNIRRKTYG